MKCYSMVWVALATTLFTLGGCNATLSHLETPAVIKTLIQKDAQAKPEPSNPKDWNIAFRIAQVYAPPKRAWSAQQAEYFAAHRQYFELNLNNGTIRSDADKPTNICKGSQIQLQAINPSQYLESHHQLSAKNLRTNLGLQRDELTNGTLVQTNCEMAWAQQFILLADKATLKTSDIAKVKLLMVQGGVAFLATPYNEH